MACKKSSVFKYMPSLTFGSPWIHAAKSFVILPDSIVSTHDFSSANANLAKSGVLSNFARCSKPLVHAKIEATGFVDVD